MELPFAEWESYYVIVGSAAAALTGLQFVVVVLGAEKRAVTEDAMRAFATPTIVHFGSALLISAILSAPWRSVISAGMALLLCGLAGFAYVLNVLRHTRRQQDYAPVLEDWLWHVIFPALAYAALAVAAVEVQLRVSSGLFIIGAAAVSLLFVGIHNAWDAVIYVATREQEAAQPSVSENDAPAEASGESTPTA